MGTGGVDSRTSLSPSECSDVGTGVSDEECLGSEAGAEGGAEVGIIVTGAEVDSDMAMGGKAGARSDMLRCVPYRGR